MSNDDGACWCSDGLSGGVPCPPYTCPNRPAVPSLLEKVLGPLDEEEPATEGVRFTAADFVAIASDDGDETEIATDLRAEVKRLSDLLNVDRTGLAAGLNHVRAVAKGYSWIAAGEWGSYDYTERTIDTLRKEVGHLIQGVTDAVERALKASGKRADEGGRGAQIALASAATDTQARECECAVQLCPSRTGHADSCPLATPAPAGDAEVSHEQARLCIGNIRHEEAWKEARLYIDQCEARQQQADWIEHLLERERHDHEETKGYRQHAEQERDELRATLQGKDEAIAELQAELDLHKRSRLDYMTQRDELSRKLEAAERRLATFEPSPPDDPTPEEPLTRDDVLAIAREAIAEVVMDAANRPDSVTGPLQKLAEAAKEKV